MKLLHVVFTQYITYIGATMAEIKVLPIQNKNIQPIIKHNTPIETSLGVLHQHKITAHQQPKNTNAQNSTLLGENINQPLAQMLNDPLSAMQYTVVMQTLKELFNIPDTNLNELSSPFHALLNALHGSFDGIVSELQHQNQDTSQMQGTLFDHIRSALRGANSERQEALLKLVVMLNTLQQQPLIIKSLDNQLKALHNALVGEQRELFENLVAQVDLQGSNESIVKSLNALLKLSEPMFLHESTQLLLRMVHYNASRLFHAVTKSDVITLLTTLFQMNSQDATQLLESQLSKTLEPNSKVLQALIEIFTKDTASTTVTSFNDIAIKLVRVMLSSPSHVLPLMHFILPLKWQNIECFSECWVALDPHNHEQPSTTFHVLLSLNVLENTMEVEIKGTQQRLSILASGNQTSLPWLQALEKPMRHYFSKSVFTLDSYGVIMREKVRSIAEVFTEYEDTFKGINEYV